MKYAIFFASICMAAPLSAQNAAPAAQSAPAAAPMVAAIAPATTANVLRAGTEVPMITREDLTTKKKQLRVGQRIQIEVAGNIMQNGMVVVPAGTPGVAELTEVRNKGMWGKSGYIAGRILSMRMGDRQVRLTGTFDDKGVTGTAGVVAAVATIPLVGFFTTGTSASIPTGSAIKAFLDEDLAYTPVAAPAPIAVPAVAPGAGSPAAE
ncbi:hypothetical protein B0I00_1912 [Novosphingobium kunmingense]|uniref:Uncharacterized protein n=1 Tax=Novosphingobium kunmingense TaxID=1211806 RepID=A0A2N0HL53_9SPHN|nr:hypothetical protein [Novosphingobium kunmingense]PKB19672.1 hypothetical protein B0I00_1912 [Novosphingobium kunmingense]